MFKITDSPGTIGLDFMSKMNAKAQSTNSAVLSIIKKCKSVQELMGVVPSKPYVGESELSMYSLKGNEHGAEIALLEGVQSAHHYAVAGSFESARDAGCLYANVGIDKVVQSQSYRVYVEAAPVVMSSDVLAELLLKAYALGKAKGGISGLAVFDPEVPTQMLSTDCVQYTDTMGVITGKPGSKVVRSFTK